MLVASDWLLLTLTCAASIAAVETLPTITPTSAAATVEVVPAVLVCVLPSEKVGTAAELPPKVVLVVEATLLLALLPKVLAASVLYCTAALPPLMPTAVVEADLS